MRGGVVLSAWALFTAVRTPALADDKLEEGLVCLWDGTTFDNWQISENPDSWSIEVGQIIANGPRSHLYDVGDLAPLKNLVLKVDCKTEPNSNSGIYFHTKVQGEGWPKQGYESQVNNSHADPIRSGSLWSVVNVMQTHIDDGEWWTKTITVKDDHIRVELNDVIVVDDHQRPLQPFDPEDYQRYLSEGTFCFQAHDPVSKVSFKNIRVKKLD